MSKSIFTQIREGDMPGEIIYRGEQVFAMMTIAPHNPGHCLVIPVEEIADFEELPDALFQHVMSVAKQLAQIEKRLYGCPKVALAVAGMEVDHTHIHIYPLYAESDMNPAAAKHPPMEEVAAEADKIRAALRENPIV
ncbi:MAG: HIT family protein [Candidatus Saccharibacteria bacterium]